MWASRGGGGGDDVYSIHHDSVCTHDAPGREYALMGLEMQLSRAGDAGLEEGNRRSGRARRRARRGDQLAAVLLETLGLPLGLRSSHMLPVVASRVSLSSGSLCRMRNLPDDAAARREWLERWAAQQEANRSPTRPARAWVPRRLALARAMRRQLALARARVRFRSEQLAIRVFERGLDFEGHVSEPEHDHPDRVHYVPSPRWMLPRVLRLLGVSDRDTLVDFGCGKGRVVHQAAKRPFRRVIGVEISPALAEIARTNLATRRHQHRCPNVEIVVADAKEFPVPDDLTIAYFWHPFAGETREAVLRGIIDSIDRHPRRVRLIYLGPRPEVLATGRFRLLQEHQNFEGRGWSIAIFESL